MQDAINVYKMCEYQLLGNVHEKEELYNKNEIIMVYLSKEKSASEFIQTFNDLRDRALSVDQFKTQLKDIYNYELDNKTESEVSSMCNFSQYVKEETTIENILNIMDSFKMTVDQVMDGLKLSEVEKEKYRSLILEIIENRKQ